MTPNPDDFDLDVEAPDSTQAPTHIYVAPGHRYRLVASSVFVTAILVAVIAWSLKRAESSAATASPTTPGVPTPPVVPAPAPTSAPGPASASAPTSALGPAPATAAPREAAAVVPARVSALSRPRRVPALLSLTLAELRPNAALQPVRLADALGDGVSVLNLWATYCGPCLRELPAFRELAARDRWGREVRFIPVMVDQLRPGDPAQTAALEQLRRISPNYRLLVDPGDQIGEALRAATIHEGAAILPVTLAFHCDELAWVQLGELDPALLAEALQHLRRRPRCEPPERPTTPPTFPTTDPVAAPAAPVGKPDSCGDGRCDRTRDETCANCRVDCGCPLGSSCILNTSGATHCARDETALKD